MFSPIEPCYVEQGGHMFSHVCQKPHNQKYQEQYLTQTCGTGFYLGGGAGGCVYIHVCTGMHAYMCASVYTAGMGNPCAFAQFCCELKTIIKNEN